MNNFLKILRKYKKDIFILVCISFGILFAYKDLPYVYFMHDEWRAQGLVLLEGWSAWINRFSFFELALGLKTSRLLGSMLNNIFYYCFPFQSYPFIIFTILTHGINSLLLYQFIYKLTKNKFVAFLSSLFFATSSATQQALSWIGASIQILGSTAFSLLSVFEIKRYIDTKKNKFFFIAVLFGYTGFLFKEIGAIALIYAIGSLLYVYHRGPLMKILTIWKKLWYIPVFSFSVLFVIPLFIKNAYTHMIFNSLYYPFVSLSQMVIPFRFMERLGSNFLSMNYPIIAGYNDAPTIANFITTDIVSIFFTFVMLIVLFFVYVKTKRKIIFLLAISWYFISFLPIAVSLIHKNSSYIDSRHLYIPYVGMSVILSIVTETIWLSIRARMKLTSKLLGIFVLTLIFIKQCSVTRREVYATAISGIQMKTFIDAFRKEQKRSVQPVKPVYYFVSDRNYYYVNNKLPFLLGSGYVISVIEYPNGSVPDEIIKKEMFLDFGSQGYFEKNGQGFGYYWDFDTLCSDIQTRTISLNQIIAYKYDSKTGILVNITDSIKKILNRY